MALDEAMKKRDEILLLKRILTEEHVDEAVRMSAREVARSLGIHDKRSEYLLTKAVDAGWLDCGVNVAYARPTDLGRTMIAALRTP